MPQRNASQDKPTAPEWLVDLLQRLAAADVAAAAVGPAALAIARGVSLPWQSPCTLVAWGGDPGRAQAVIDACSLPVAVDLTWQMGEGAGDQSALMVATEAASRAAHIRAWSLTATADGRVVDRLGALDAFDEGRLLLTREPRAVLRRDAAAVLQVGVWAAQTGLAPGAEIVRLAQRESGHVLGLQRSVWQDHFNQLLMGQHAGVGLRFLFECRVLQLMLPEVCAMVDFHRGCPVHHKDIWDHTLKVIEKCPQNLAVRWAALMHDTGKVWTRTVSERGRVHFFRHEELGASLMEGVAGRFHLDPTLRDRVVYVIANHARANVYSTEWTDSAVRRLIRDMGECLDDVIAFSQSDYTTKRAWRIKEVRVLAAELRDRIARIAADDAKVPPLPKGFGLLVMSRAGRSGGPWLGSIQAWLEAQVEAGEIEGGLDAETYYDYVVSHRPEMLTAQQLPAAVLAAAARAQSVESKL